MDTLSPPIKPLSNLSMWFTKQIQVWRAQFANRKKGVSHPPTKRMQCAEQLRRLTPERFIHYRPASGLGVKLSVCYPNIDVYARHLREIALLVESGGAVSPTQVKDADHVLTLDRFLTSADGYYLEVVPVVTQFKAHALHLCEALEAADYTTHGLPEHNLRMLTKLFSNVLLLATHLNEVSREA